ncbi:MAG TPA: hypothetical protein VG994_19360 [Steroidobacteraceae bacterium]|nr:hypothetical protein [Steroidobacteraceae bacterium]
MRHFFQSAVPITMAQLHDFYDVMDCEYRGKLVLNGALYDFSINGGS